MIKGVFLVNTVCVEKTSTHTRTVELQNTDDFPIESNASIPTNFCRWSGGFCNCSSNKSSPGSPN